MNTVTVPKRLPLARLPTPIHRLDRLSREVGKEIYVWRDDLTGFAESGNKIRKLEFLLAGALVRKASRVISAGGTQSNHTRATTFLCRQLGLEISLVVREPKLGRSSEPATGNLLLNQICGAELHYISYREYQKAGSVYLPFLEELAEAARQRGETPYIIPEGGSVPLGCWGYITAVEEMLQSWRAEAGTKFPDALFFALGSGGTHAGLYLGYLIHQLPVNRLWAINVCDSAEYFQKRVGALIESTAKEFHLSLPDSTLQILDGHFGEGYGVASEDDLRFYARIAKMEGLLLDPVYTGKAFQGMLAEIRKAPERFGDKILFLHSGGAFANFAYAEQFQRALS